MASLTFLGALAVAGAIALGVYYLVNNLTWKDK